MLYTRMAICGICGICVRPFTKIRLILIISIIIRENLWYLRYLRETFTKNPLNLDYL